jgi:hypothetical protein
MHKNGSQYVLLEMRRLTCCIMCVLYVEHYQKIGHGAFPYRVGWLT